MIQKLINFIARIFGLRKKPNQEKEKQDKKNPDDIYPLW
jgi:hypothetical protein